MIDEQYLISEAARLYEEITGLSGHRVRKLTYDNGSGVAAAFGLPNHRAIGIELNEHTTPEHIRMFIEDNIDLLTKPTGETI